MIAYLILGIGAGMLSLGMGFLFGCAGGVIGAGIGLLAIGAVFVIGWSMSNSNLLLKRIVEQLEENEKTRKGEEYARMVG